MQTAGGDVQSAGMFKCVERAAAAVPGECPEHCPPGSRRRRTRARTGAFCTLAHAQKICKFEVPNARLRYRPHKNIPRAAGLEHSGPGSSPECFQLGAGQPLSVDFVRGDCFLPAASLGIMASCGD